MVDIIRTSTVGASQDGINQIIKQQHNLQYTNLQVAKGKRIVTTADDPVGAAQSLSLRQFQEMTQNNQKNIEVATNKLEIEETALRDAHQNILIRAQELVTAAIHGGRSPIDKYAIAGELKQLLSQLVSIANTRNGAEYLFAGFKTLALPVTQVGGQYVYHGDEGQELTLIGPASEVAVNDNGKAIFFDVPAANIAATSYSGQTRIVSTASGLVNVGSLTGLSSGQLILNTIPIGATTGDGLSSTDSAASSLAIANAINANRATHKVLATANATVYTLGTVTAGALAAGDLTLNGISIQDATGTESTLIAAINAVQAQTNVVATQPGGAGTAVILTAANGQNIQLQTNGAAASGVSFSGFSLGGAALNEVARGTVTLTNYQSISLAGSAPNNAGFTAGTYAVTVNGGTGSITTPVLVGVDTNFNAPTPRTETYTLQFSSATTYSIYSFSDPTTPISGYAGLTYTAGSPLTVQGVEVTISGTPNAGDIFTINLESTAYQDIFTTLQEVITAIQLDTHPSRPFQLAYEGGVALTNIQNAIANLGEIRAQIGARLNILKNQKDSNEEFIYLTRKSISQIEDLDYAQAITALSLQLFALEAAEKSFVKLQEISLFDYIRA